MLLSVVSLVIWIRVNRGFDGLVFGHVVSIETGALSIEDRKEGVTRVLVGTGTSITDRGVPVLLENIPEGQFVHIDAERLERHLIRAKAIRLMRSPRPGPHTPPDAPPQ